MNSRKETRDHIFKLFLTKDSLQFHEIEKVIKIRSNKLAYHLQQLQKQGLLIKKEESYTLTPEGETRVPTFLSNNSPLPVIVVGLVHQKILLIKRNKRPYKEYWSLLGGRWHFRETIQEGSIRIVQERTGLEAEFTSLNAVLHEHVVDDIHLKHSFILFFTTAKIISGKIKETDHGSLKWFNLKNIERQKIIPTDLWLIKNKLSSQTNITNATMQENKGMLLLKQATKS